MKKWKGFFLWKILGDIICGLSLSDVVELVNYILYIFTSKGDQFGMKIHYGICHKVDLGFIRYIEELICDTTVLFVA